MRFGVSCFRHCDRERIMSPSWKLVPCSVSQCQWQAGSWACETAADVVEFVGCYSPRGMCRALRSTAALAMRWVPSEIHVAEKPSLRGLRPFTWRRAAPSRCSTSAECSRNPHGAPARRAYQNHPWNQIVSPPCCGHRRSGAQRQGMKNALVRAGAMTIAGGRKDQESSSSATSLCIYRREKDVPAAALVRVVDERVLRLCTPHSTIIDGGAMHPDNLRLGGKDDLQLEQCSRRGQMTPSPCQTSVSSRWLPLPQPVLAAVVMTLSVRQQATSNGHDVKFAVGAWLGAHAHLRPMELARISWKWVTSDGNGNSDRAAIVLHPVVESKASKTGERDDIVTLGNAALLHALLWLRAQRLSRSRLTGVSEALWETFDRAIALFRGPGETSALSSSTYGSLRRRVGPEAVAGRD